MLLFIRGHGFLRSTSAFVCALFLFVSGTQAEPPREVPRELLRLRVAGKMAAFAQYKMELNGLVKQPQSPENEKESDELIRILDDLLTDVVKLYRESPTTYEGMVVSKEWLNAHGHELAQASKDYARAAGDKNEEGSRLLSLVYGLTPSEAIREMTLARSQQQAVSEAIRTSAPGRADTGQVSDDELRAYIRGENNPSLVENYGGIDPNELTYRKRAEQGVGYGAAATGSGSGSETRSRESTTLRDQADLLERTLRERSNTQEPAGASGSERGNAVDSGERNLLHEQVDLLERTLRERESRKHSTDEDEGYENDVDAKALVREAAELMRKERYEEALLALTRAVEADPNLVIAQKLKAIAARKVKEGGEQ